MLKRPLLRSAITTFPDTLLPPLANRHTRLGDAGGGSKTQGVTVEVSPRSPDAEEVGGGRKGAGHSLGTVSMGGRATTDAQLV